MRKLHIGNETWEYKVGKGSTVIVSPNGKKVVARNWDIVDLLPHVFEKGQYRGNEDGMVKPSLVKDYIINKLKKV